MPNIIDTIQLSGNSYDVKDKSATTVVSLTQVEYDALPSSAKTDTSKMYIISDAEAGDLSQYWTSAQTNSAITQAVSGKVNTSSVVSSVTSASTDSEIPTAKAVWEAASGAGKTYTAGRGIDVTNEVISVSLPISAGTGTYSLIFNNASNKASGICAHAEGYSTNANGYTSHAEGYITSANGYGSHAEGSNTITQNQSEHASGQYNVSSSASTTFGDSGNTLFSVGNGTASNARHNAFEVRQNGDIYIQSGNTDIKLQDHLGGGGIDSGTVQTMIDKSISGKADSSSLATVATTGDYDDLTNKPTIPTVPTDVSAFNNDAGYATSGYVNSSVSGKLDTSVFNAYSASVQSIISDWVAEMIGVEYIQSTDGYQYINLGYVPSGDGVEIGGEIMIVSYPSTAQWMTTAYIAYTGEQYEAFRMIRRSNEDGTLYCNHHTKASGQGQAMSMTLGNKYTFKFTDSEYQFGADTYTNTGGTGTTNTTAIKLFGNGSAIGAITRIYSFYIKKDNALVMNLIPVVKNGVGMMYDKISGQFFGNNGTGSFTFPS